MPSDHPRPQDCNLVVVLVLVLEISGGTNRINPEGAFFGAAARNAGYRSASFSGRVNRYRGPPPPRLFFVVIMPTTTGSCP
jgi:hypothetical protein